MKERILGIFLALTLFTSCGGVQTVAVKTTASIIYDASFEVETETNWENFRYGVMSNLKLMEGFLYVDKENKNLLVSLLKGYAGYAFAINETLYMEDFFSDSEDPFQLYQAISNYERALEYGFRYFKLQGLDEKKLMGYVSKEKELKEFLSENFDDDDQSYEAVLFTAQAMAGLINLQRDRMELVAQLPVAKTLFDWVCKRSPDINHGACKLFYGAYEAGRPRTLGGNPEKGKKIFLQAMDDYSDNWLMHIGYIQFYLIPMLEEDDFNKMMARMAQFKEKFHKSHRWRPGKREELDEEEKRILFFQALALKRYDIIKKYKKEIF